MKLYAKALIAFAGALTGSLAVGLTEGGLAAAEVLAAVSAGFVTAGGVFGIRNGSR